MGLLILFLFPAQLLPALLPAVLPARCMLAALSGGKFVRDENGLVAAEARVPEDTREIVAAWNLVERAQLQWRNAAACARGHPTTLCGGSGWLPCQQAD
jgi:hypothetical protein